LLHQAHNISESELLQHCMAHPVEQVCLLLDLNRSSIYRHKQVKPKQISQHEQHVINRICTIFKMSGCNYGSRRIQRTLNAENIAIGRYKVRHIMRQQNLKTTWTRAFIRTTDSKHNMKVADNVLDQQFNPDAQNKAWVADITYIWTASGWLYLAAVMDLYYC
jgi:putative transposase